MLTTPITFQMNNIISSACSNDCTRLQQEIGHYVAPNSSVAGVMPPINSSSLPTQFSLNHPILARLLCPTEAVGGYDDDLTEYTLCRVFLLPTDLFILELGRSLRMA